MKKEVLEQEVKLIGEVSQEQIDKWKADPKIQRVHGIVVDGHIGYVKKPDRNTVSYALSQMSFKVDKGDKSLGENATVEMSMGKMYKQGEAVLTNCWLGGSEEMRKDTSLYVGACMIAGELIEIKEGELKNF